MNNLSIFPLKNTFISSKDNTVNFSSSPHLFLGKLQQKDSTFNSFITLLEFDISDLYNYSNVTNSKLNIFVLFNNSYIPQNSMDIFISSISSEYDSKNVNWNTRPTMLYTGHAIKLTKSQNNSYISHNISDLINNSISKNEKIFKIALFSNSPGLLALGSNESRESAFLSLSCSTTLNDINSINEEINLNDTNSNNEENDLNELNLSPKLPLSNATFNGTGVHQLIKINEDIDWKFSSIYGKKISWSSLNPRIITLAPNTRYLLSFSINISPSACLECQLGLNLLINSSILHSYYSQGYCSTLNKLIKPTTLSGTIIIPVSNSQVSLELQNISDYDVVLGLATLSIIEIDS